MSKVDALPLQYMRYNFTNVHWIFITFSLNGSHRNEGYDDVKIYTLNEKEKGEKEDLSLAPRMSYYFIHKEVQIFCQVFQIKDVFILLHLMFL